MDYLSILDQYRDQMIESLQESVQIRSVREEPYADFDGSIYPFGTYVEEAYEHILMLGRKFGFEVQDYDHFGGHIEWKSEDQDAKTIGIAGHIDVVPEGDGWTFDPYEGAIKDGKIYGRGTMDDKGPVIECLYAMKALKDSGFEPRKNIRLIIGLDEETSKDGMAYYIENAGMPDEGFTPDGDFPVINGEMGILIFDFIKRVKPVPERKGLILKKIEAGTAPNVVPGRCRAIIQATNAKKYDDIRKAVELYAEETGHRMSVKKAGTSLMVEAIGKPAHGGHPELGVNAISIMMEFLGRLDFVGTDAYEMIDFYNNRIGFDIHGERIGCDLSDEPSGKLILNVGMAELSRDVATLTVNVRYPVTCTEEEVYAGIEGVIESTSIGILKRTANHPMYVEPDDELVRKLLSAYREETGDYESEPKVISGGTYAKMFAKMAAFGPLFPGEEDRNHQADEYISIESMMKAARVYARAIKLMSE